MSINETIPNDPRFAELWGMRNTGQTGGTPGADISAAKAWDLQQGSRDVIVAVIDTGVDYTHPDLAANIWINTGEIPGNGIDDDGNGFVDDIYGYDFANGDANPMDDHGHGTHCSGTIGGVGNNGMGVAGVNWNVRIMAMKFLDAGGSGSTADAISCIQYATRMGANVMSNSWGGSPFEQSLMDAITAADGAGILFIAAAGNDSTNNDVTPHYPSSYDCPNIIAVLATDSYDALAGFSCWGPTTVDLGAPGVDILSCQPGGGYQLMSGASMATPHVSGAAALVWAANRGMTHLQVKNILMSTVDPVVPGLCVTGGRINAERAVRAVPSLWLTATPTSGTVAAGSSAPWSIGMSAAKLKEGVYWGRIQADSNDPITSRLVIPVTLTVLTDPLVIAPAGDLVSNGLQGGPFVPASIDYRLSNVGAGTINWNATCDAWVSVTPAGGSLTAGNSTTVTVAYSASVAAFAPGVYSGAVSFFDPATSVAQKRSVELTVLDWLSVTPPGGLASRGVPGGPFSPSSFDYTLHNLGSAPLNWTAAGDQTWFTVTPASGTLASGGSAAVAASLSAQAAALPTGMYHGVATFTDTSSGHSTTRSVSLMVAPDYFTQLFSSADNDLAFHTLTLVPNGGASFYQAFCQDATSFPTDPAGGIMIPMANDFYGQVTLTGAQVSLYGTAYSSFYVGSNGYITFGSGSSGNAESLSAHFSLPRISGLFDDLNPTSGSVTWKQLSDRAAVTYSNVPLYSGGGANSFQIEMFFDGRISITWLALTDASGLAGVSRGLGLPTDFIMSDLTAYPPPIVDDLSISPKSSFTASGPAGGPFLPAGTTYTLTNNSTTTLAWTAAHTQPWLSALPAGGSLGPGASVEVVVSLTSAAGTLVSGVYYDAVLFTNLASGAQQSRVAAVRVGQKNILAYVQYADMSATGEVANTFAAISSIGAGYTRTGGNGMGFDLAGVCGGRRRRCPMRLLWKIPDSRKSRADDSGRLFGYHGRLLGHCGFIRSGRAGSFELYGGERVGRLCDRRRQCRGQDRIQPTRGDQQIRRLGQCRGHRA
ncbi:MAG: S8 family serine peptidase [Candidatus Sumerlaeota bacterium]|nr:S8 family serine peptidase [Candidatus Sumerlaeota bacterium]